MPVGVTAITAQLSHSTYLLRICLAIDVHPFHRTARPKNLGLLWQRPTMMKRIAINSFLIFHLALIFCWAMPVNSRLVTGARPVIASYMIWSGLAQGWNLFAPNPLAINYRVDAEITYRDGQKCIWSFPRPQDFGYMKRYTLERQHKFGFDSLQSDKLAFLRPDASRFVARLNNTKENNPPLTVTLVGYQSKIAPPGSGLPEPWTRREMYTYSVQAGDLK